MNLARRERPASVVKTRGDVCRRFSVGPSRAPALQNVDLPPLGSERTAALKEEKNQCKLEEERILPIPIKTKTQDWLRFNDFFPEIPTAPKAERYDMIRMYCRWGQGVPGPGVGSRRQIAWHHTSQAWSALPSHGFGSRVQPASGRSHVFCVLSFKHKGMGTPCGRLTAPVGRRPQASGRSHASPAPWPL